MFIQKGTKYSNVEPEVRNGWKIKEFVEDKIIKYVKRLGGKTCQLYMEKKGDGVWHVGILRKNGGGDGEGLPTERTYIGHRSASEYMSNLADRY